MDQLIHELPKPVAGSKPEEMEAYGAKLARYMVVKEQHAERVKAEVRVIWGDYFTAELAAKHPTVHEMVFKILKTASKARQGTNLADAEELVKSVQEFAEVFWKTKGAQTKRLPSMQKSGGEIVYPVGAA
jgi:nickel superoxide dismutase